MDDVRIAVPLAINVGPHKRVAMADLRQMASDAVDDVRTITDHRGAAARRGETKGKEIYLTYPDSIGTSKLKLGVTSTARNWNTILKLADLASG